MIDLRPFQRRFLAGAFRPGIDTAALSIPRGNGKSTLAGYILGRCMTPGDALHRAGAEYLLLAGSIKQARHVFRALRLALPGRAYRWRDSSTVLGCTHRASGASVNVISSKAKTAMGIVGCPLAVADEPGAWETVGGGLMHTALRTAQGKPGSPLKVIYIGTVAPAVQGGWWPEMIERGSSGDVFVQALQGDPARWDQWPEIRRCNPLAGDAAFRRKLLAERDAAREDTRLKADFLSYRLNLPTPDESAVLLTVEDWDLVIGREVPPASGRPIFGYDIGAGRAWSAGVALWPQGRLEALAVAPGIPSLEAQERRDRVPAGTYRRLADAGVLRIAEGLRVQPPEMLHRACLDAWGTPAGIVCDRFQLNALRDAVGAGIAVAPRMTRWSESTEDIRALRKIAKDGPLACAPGSRALVEASLAVSQVLPDDAGNVRMVKRGTHNEARDDVAAALALAAGAWARMPKRTGGVYLGKVA